ncbi:hypothetical protein [Frigidibacter oleivorans]|uniref:hypothetical protein n=1 Tax=Frigidibacter oleivorans TaxID=2487129 RepID=UPI000F8EA5B4|nr:hypothetical protein [Frigidibacter oleivorans]
MTELETIERLRALIEMEEGALAARDLRRLAALAPEAEAVLAQIDRALPAADPASLRTLRARAESNRRRLGAVLKGLRGALRRVQSIRRAGDSLQAYDAFGRPAEIGRNGGTLVRT